MRCCAGITCSSQAMIATARNSRPFAKCIVPITILPDSPSVRPVSSVASTPALARANAGVPGVDGVTFKQIEASGVEAWLAGFREELVSETYRPDAGRRGGD